MPFHLKSCVHMRTSPSESTSGVLSGIPCHRRLVLGEVFTYRYCLASFSGSPGNEARYGFDGDWIFSWYPVAWVLSLHFDMGSHIPDQKGLTARNVARNTRLSSHGVWQVWEQVHVHPPIQSFTQYVPTQIHTHHLGHMLLLHLHFLEYAGNSL